MTTTWSKWLSVSPWWRLAAIVPVLLFATFVWPTRYRYGQWHDGGNVQEVRTDRLTGAVEVLTVYGWVNFQKNESAGPLDLPASELKVIEVNCQSRSDKYPNYSREEVEEVSPPKDLVAEAPKNTVMGGKLDCRVYNGSRWNVSELELLVTNGTRSRRFKIYAGTSALTAGSVFVDTGLPEDEAFRVAIARATGYKAE